MTVLRRFARPDVLDAIPLASHAWIEASAGTGKTFTLEHLIVDLIVRAGARLDEILVLTFTEKATLEMRERVRSTLVALVHAGPEDPRVNPVDPTGHANVWELDEAALERLSEAVAGFEGASIHTIHGYCQRVLKEHAFRSRDLFDQTLTDTKLHFRRAVRAVLREALRPEDPAHHVLAAALLDQTPTQLTETLEQWAPAPGVLMPPASLEKVHAAAALCAPAPRLHALLAAAREDGAKTRGPLAEHVEALHACANDVLATDDLMDAAAIIARFHARMHGTKPAWPWMLERAGKNPLLARALAPFEALLGGVPHFPMLVVQTLLPRVVHEVKAAKQAHGEMDFDDLIARVRDALTGEGGARLEAALRAQHRFAIVDEFQDTDAAQWEIFWRLFFDGNERPEDVPLDQRRALYLIGDPKQAIYAFRGADVHTYLSARAALASHTQRVVLKDNYRSTAGVIGAYNAIFARGFFAGPIRYDVPVTCGNPLLVAKQADGRDAAPLVLLRPQAEGDRKLGADDVRDVLASAIAAEIERLLGDGPGALRVGREGALRPLQPSDIYVLGRTTKDLDGVHDRLSSRGIPCAYFKRHGLFATREAEDLLMVLRAVADPGERSHRLKAWLTPFFGLQLEELRGDESLHDDHPLVARLVRLRERCEVRDYAGFARELLHESGLARRELFVEESARRLTNYQHLVDILLESAHGRRLTVDELVVDFQQLVQGQGGPEVGDDIERVATEGSAVQLLTMHKSKGLEAEVVFVLGGLASAERPGRGPRVRHVNGVREAWMRPLPASVASDVTREQSEEDERLFYVALTRARSRLYLPFFGGDAAAPGDFQLRPNAPYFKVREALASLVGASPSTRPPWIELRDVLASTPSTDAARSDEDPTVAAEAAATIPSPSPLDPQAFAALRRRHRGPLATSYTRLAGRRMRTLTEGAPKEEPKVDVHDAPSLAVGASLPAVADPAPANAVARASLVLPGGAATGIFLHEALERVDLHFVASAASADELLTRDPGGSELRALLEGCAARNGVAVDHVEVAAQVLFHALRTPLPTRRGVALPLVEATRVVREMSFQFPIPEAQHPSLGSAPPLHVGRDGTTPFRVERGIVRGVVDVVFEHDSAIYFLDWKSDRVEGDPATLRAHVEAHYDLQIKLYTLGVLRLLGVWDEAAYERSFGGHLYAFLRPMAQQQPGVVFARPTFADVQRWERELLGTSFAGAPEALAGGAS